MDVANLQTLYNQNVINHSGYAKASSASIQPLGGVSFDAMTILRTQAQA